MARACASGLGLCLLAALAALALPLAVDAGCLAAGPPSSPYVSLWSYWNKACPSWGTPTFELMVMFFGEDLDATHQLQLYVRGPSGDLIPNFSVTSPKGGSKRPGQNVWTFTTGATDLPRSEQGDRTTRDVHITLRLPKEPGSYFPLVNITGSRPDGTPCEPVTAQLFTTVSEYGFPMVVLPQNECYDGFYPRGPDFWAEFKPGKPFTGQGYYMWDGIPDNANHSPLDAPAGDVVTCPCGDVQPGACPGRPACFHWPPANEPGGWRQGLQLGNFHRGWASPVPWHDEWYIKLCPVWPPNLEETPGNLCYLYLNQTLAREAINGRGFTGPGAKTKTSPRPSMYRHLIANWLNWLASYPINPKLRPNEQAIRLAIRWIQYGEDPYFHPTAAVDDAYWASAWSACGVPQLCGARATALRFMASHDIYNTTVVPPDQCGRCIARLLNFYPTPTCPRPPL